MQASIFLAKLIGPFALIVGLSTLVNARAMRGIVEEFLRSPALIFLSGIITLPAGIAIALTHNVWVANWPVIITIIGWLGIVGGAIRLLAPQRAAAFGKALYAHPAAGVIGTAFWVAIGAVLTFFGYFH